MTKREQNLRRDIERAQRRVEEQRRWIADHGQTLSGYVQRYGSASDPDHYGDGGERIYTADARELERLEDRAALLRMELVSYTAAEFAQPSRFVES